jgi:shikimate dehydrogenase
LATLHDRLDGLSITSPYKRHFIGQIEVPDSMVAKLASVNTLSFLPDRVLGTNTDLVAVVEILKNYQASYPRLALILLGDGAMAKVTETVAFALRLPLQKFSRRTHPNLAFIDLRPCAVPGYQTIIINSCARDFVFLGQFNGDEIFWDYNYAFPAHSNTLPDQLSAYHDGQELLELQARAAIAFWRKHNPKLK